MYRSAKGSGGIGLLRAARPGRGDPARAGEWRLPSPVARAGSAPAGRSRGRRERSAGASAVAGTERRRSDSGEAVVADDLHSAGAVSNVYRERGSRPQSGSGAGLEVEDGPGRGRGSGWARHYSRRRAWKFSKARGEQGVVVMSAVPGGPGDSAVELELVAIEMRGDAMRRRYAAAALGVILIVGAKEYAQQPAAAAPEVR